MEGLIRNNQMVIQEENLVKILRVLLSVMQSCLLQGDDFYDNPINMN